MSFFQPCFRAAASGAGRLTVGLTADDLAAAGHAPGRRLRTWTLLVANAGRIPGGIDVFPDAVLDDGRLDVMELPLRHRTEWGPVAFAGLTGHRIDTRALRYTKVSTLWAVPDHPTPFHLDGDDVGPVVDLRIRVQHAALQVRVPAGS